MKRLLLTTILALVYILTFAQTPRVMNIPDIKGYKTLIADIHTHTIYSDGGVTPAVRVEEAINEGLDIIFVTEHIEVYCRKVDSTRSANLNTSYSEYIKAAKGTDLIVVRGGEISRGMPPGHLNCLFLNDVTPLETALNDEGIWVAVENAIKQGAFVVWNHPNWKYQQPDTTKWFDFHTQLHKKGWLHGIEITNHTDVYCPEALSWYREYNLAPLSGSDTHSKTYDEFNLKEKYRPVSLIFARERTINSAKEAMFARRTLAYRDNILYGGSKLLKELFDASVSLYNHAVTKGDIIEFKNSSDIEFVLKSTKSNRTIFIKPNTITKVEFDCKIKADSKYMCKNMVYADKMPLVVDITKIKMGDR